MIQSLIDGICTAIAKEFGDDYVIYTDRVEQGLEDPCFFVQIIDHSYNRHRNGRFWNENSIVVQYIPKEGTETSIELYEISDRLSDILTDIEADGCVLHGIKSDCEIDDEVLTLSINYNYFSNVIEDPKDLMMKHKLNAKVRR